jgi:hypothetical protein
MAIQYPESEEMNTHRSQHQETVTRCAAAMTKVLGKTSGRLLHYAAIFLAAGALFAISGCGSKYDPKANTAAIEKAFGLPGKTFAADDQSTQTMAASAAAAIKGGKWVPAVQILDKLRKSSGLNSAQAAAVYETFDACSRQVMDLSIKGDAEARAYVNKLNGR